MNNIQYRTMFVGHFGSIRVKKDHLPSHASEPLILSSSRAFVRNQQTVQGRKPMQDVKNAMTFWWLINYE